MYIVGESEKRERGGERNDVSVYRKKLIHRLSVSWTCMYVETLTYNFAFVKVEKNEVYLPGKG